MKKFMKVEGMHCGGCSGRLSEGAGGLARGGERRGSHEAGTASVVCAAEVTDEAIRAAIDGAGFKCASIEDAG